METTSIQYAVTCLICGHASPLSGILPYPADDLRLMVEHCQFQHPDDKRVSLNHRAKGEKGDDGTVFIRFRYKRDPILAVTYV